MVFPESDRVVFDKNPLTQVICQLRFPPILKIVGDPAGFQDRIRDSYPLYERDEGLPREVQQAISGAGISGIVGDVTHKFISADRLNQVSISKNFVASSTEKYGRWEDFRREIVRAVDATRDEYVPAFYERIGLRYMDTVNRAQLGLEDKNWSDLIRREFLGPIAVQDIAGAVGTYQAQAVFSLTDIENSFVQLRYGLDQNGESFFVDADYYVTGQYDEDKAFVILDSFNRTAGNLFRWIIKPSLRNALGVRAD